MLTRMYLYSTSTKLSIDVWLYLDRPGSLKNRYTVVCSQAGTIVNKNFLVLLTEHIVCIMIVQT